MVTFISYLSGGHVSEKALTINCGLIELLKAGDVVMVDKGFDVQDLLYSCKEGYFKFLREKGICLRAEEAKIRCITSVHIHVERAIECIRNYRILVPLSLHEQLDLIWFICCMFTNFLVEYKISVQCKLEKTRISCGCITIMKS